MKQEEYLFVDGGYLRGVLESLSNRFFDGFALELNQHALFGEFYKSFYYDCLPERRKGEDSAAFDQRVASREAFFRDIQATPGVHLFQGVVRGQKRIRQKTIDVAIAVDMLSHSHRRNMARATLLAGDLDFKPLLDALVYDGMYVTLWFEPSSASDDLVLAADAQRQITVESLWPLLSPATLAAYPRPGEGTEKRKNRPAPLMVGKSGYGTEVFLHEENGRYLIVSRSDSSEYEGLVSHPDRDFLLRYAQDRYKGIVWE